MEAYHYLFNPKYVAKASLYPLYTRQKNIVMLGSSLTGNVNWDELLDRSDVANRGIDGDISEGILARMEYVLSVDPEICFIELGINDIAKKVTDELIIKI